MTIPFEAMDLILKAVEPRPVERVSLDHARGRALAEDILSQENIPPFNNSSMDGFAVRTEDIRPGASLRVVGTVAAGQSPLEVMTPGTAIRIMTGAPVPQGADAVVPLEHAVHDADWVEFPNPAERGANIRLAGEDVRQGDRVLEAGIPLKPAAIGVLASLGVTRVPVRMRPRVALLGTGSELVEADQIPGPGQIRDSNSHSIGSQIAACGAIPSPVPRIKDTLDSMRTAIQQAMEHCDVLMTTGGVSAGDFDFVKPALESLGARKVFWKVSQRPGGPFGFWVLDGKPVFGIPGNPVSAMVIVEEYVRPALRRMMGFKHLARPIRTALMEEAWRKPRLDGKTEFLRVRLTEAPEGLRASLTGSQSSGVLTSMLLAEGLAVVEGDVLELKPGDPVPVQMIELPEDH